jgi:ABC-type nitrate/sulfonate/bicarbonate transport system permease component
VGILKRGRALVSVLVLLGLWEGWSLAVGSPLLLPAPRSIALTLGQLARSGELLQHVAVSLQRLGVGLLIGVVWGIVFGCALGYWWVADAACHPFVRMANSTPALSLIPFSLLWFGVTELARYSLLVYIVALTVTINALHGVREVPQIRVRAAHCLGVSGANAFVRVIIPSAVPNILAGIRTAIGLGVMVIVAAEMLGATSGLGYLIIEARYQFNVERMFVGILGLGTLSVVLDRGFVLLTYRCLPRWSPERRIR